MKSLNKELQIELENNSYTIKFPNNGQFIEIEVMKARLTNDTYSTLTTGPTIASQLARYTVDMIAFFTVCCPQMKKDLKVESFSELDMMESKKILKVYVDQVLPWITEWEDALNSIDTPEEK